jgi:peptidoglycan/LPS O-acetylase OafA/YrhL
MWGDPWWTTLAWGGFRVAYSFPVGLLLYRHRAAIRLPRVPFTVLAGLLVVLLAAHPPGSWRPLFDLSFVLIVSPALVLAGCFSEPASSFEAAACGFLGSISYPIYTLHQPIENIVNGAVHRWAHGEVPSAWQPWLGIALLILFILLAAVADRADLHIRRNWLGRRMRLPFGIPTA